MELLLLGTAAAEGWPAPFCACRCCEAARLRGGPDVRARSGALLDGDLKLDFGADVVVQMQRVRRHLGGVRSLVFTHQHSDHIAPLELQWMTPPFSQTPPAHPVDVFGNAAVLSLIEAAQPALGSTPGRMRLHRMDPLVPVQTVTGDEILPLPADHTPGAFLLRITRGEGASRRSLFYGHDSGLYPEATLDALQAGPPLDIVLMDCTNGGQVSDNRGHMGVDGVIAMTRELRRRGAVHGASRVVATHFSHNGGLMHAELVEALKPHGIETAYDGMVISA